MAGCCTSFEMSPICLCIMGHPAIQNLLTFDGISPTIDGYTDDGLIIKMDPPFPFKSSEHVHIGESSDLGTFFLFCTLCKSL